jgi:hypothetical protein
MQIQNVLSPAILHQSGFPQIGHGHSLLVLRSPVFIGNFLLQNVEKAVPARGNRPPRAGRPANESLGNRFEFEIVLPG